MNVSLEEGRLTVFLEIREKHGWISGLKTAYWEQIAGNREGSFVFCRKKYFIKSLRPNLFISRKPDVYLSAETGLEGNPEAVYIRLHKPLKVCDWRGEAIPVREKVSEDGIC